jgi:hypothetical protein
MSSREFTRPEQYLRPVMKTGTPFWQHAMCICYEGTFPVRV